ncbi:UNVERIFIED_CONTAM: Dscam2 [Trichonephila clavipes]
MQLLYNSRNVLLNITDAPVVAPFSFPPALREGERGSALCIVRSGDIPLEFTWLKDGIDVKDIEGIKVQSVMDSAVLSISSVTSESSGNYTCIVKNAFGNDRYTSTLAVTEPPTVAAFNFQSALKEGERGSATCTIRSGDTPLEFQWLKDGQDVNNIEGIKTQSILDSSFLVISSVTSKSSGNYTCIVRNAFGSDRYTSVLAVTAPPTWKTEPKDIDIQESENGIIQCEATGVPQPEIKWARVFLRFL